MTCSPTVGKLPAPPHSHNLVPLFLRSMSLAPSHGFAGRVHLDLLPPEQTGWLAGLRDSEVGSALALMHGQASDPWTIAELAKRVGVSRSVLAERFRHF